MAFEFKDCLAFLLRILRTFPYWHRISGQNSRRNFVWSKSLLISDGKDMRNDIPSAIHRDFTRSPDQAASEIHMYINLSGRDDRNEYIEECTKEQYPDVWFFAFIINNSTVKSAYCEHIKTDDESVADKDFCTTNMSKAQEILFHKNKLCSQSSEEQLSYLRRASHHIADLLDFFVLSLFASQTISHSSTFIKHYNCEIDKCNDISRQKSKLVHANKDNIITNKYFASDESDEKSEITLESMKKDVNKSDELNSDVSISKQTELDDNNTVSKGYCDIEFEASGAPLQCSMENDYSLQDSRFLAGNPIAITDEQDISLQQCTKGLSGPFSEQMLDNIKLHPDTGIKEQRDVGVKEQCDAYSEINTSVVQSESGTEDDHALGDTFSTCQSAVISTDHEREAELMPKNPEQTLCITHSDSQRGDKFKIKETDDLKCPEFQAASKEKDHHLRAPKLPVSMKCDEPVDKHKAICRTENNAVKVTEVKSYPERTNLDHKYKDTNIYESGDPLRSSVRLRCTNRYIRTTLAVELSLQNLSCQEQLIKQPDPLQKSEAESRGEHYINDNQWAFGKVFSLRFWPEEFFSQSVHLYPVTRPGERTGSQEPASPGSRRPIVLVHLMQNEVFRLCSFSYSLFPPNVDVWVTQLAQSGFYCVSEDGRVRCFSCGREYQDFLIGSPLENAHDPLCPRHQQNRPLRDWTAGITEEELKEFLFHYGSWRPRNQDQVEFRDSGIGFQAAREDRSSQFTHSTASSGYETGSIFSREQELSDSASPEMIVQDEGMERRPTSYPEQPHDTGARMNRNRQGSLPDDLNDLSGAVVSQESSERPGSRQVLTSAAKNPITLDQVPRTSDEASGQSGSGGELGAEGGHDPTPSYDLSKASYPQFAATSARRITYSNWRSDHSHQPDDLVPAGFFYAGYADCVRCFYCGLGLKYWRADDIPAYQHARFRPNCVYNRMYKGQEYIDRVQQDIREGGLAGAPDQENTQQPTLPPAPAATPTPAPTPAPQQPDHMRTEAAQAALRTGWSEQQVRQGVNQVIRDLGGVENLTTELLRDVLTNLFPPETGDLHSGSTFGSGSGDSDQFQDARTSPENSLTPGAGAQAPVIQQPAPPEINPNEEFRLIEREHTYLTQRMTCNICKARPVSCVYLPCGHVIACAQCADDATNCKLCNKHIVGTANIYLS